MSVLAWLASLGLAAVFAVAAVAKLRDRTAATGGARALGLPAPAAAVAAVAVPASELAVAALLLGRPRAGAAAALLLLAAFTALVAANLATGRRPACACFGAASRTPIGPGTLARNGALAGAAALVLVADPAGLAVPGGLAPGSLALGLGLGLAAATPILLIALRRHGRALDRVEILSLELTAHGLPVPGEAGEVAGRPAPELVAATGIDPAGRPLLVAFTAPGCGPCAELAPRLAGWRARHAAVLAVAELDHAALPALAEAVGIEATPGAVLLAPDGRIAAAPAHGPAAIAALVDEALAELAGPAARVDRVPDLVLEAPSGEPVALRDALAGDGEVLVVLWNPECGFCRALREELPALAERVLVVADTADPGLAVPQLVDPERALARATGARGTPMAFLAAADGAVSSSLAAGGAAIRALAAPPRLEILTVEAAGAR